MEIIGLLSMLSLFSFFYYIGRTREDWVLELLGSFGYFMVGILWTITGVEFYSFDVNGILVRNFDATSQPWGILIFCVATILLIYLGNSIIKQSKKEL
jgi:hypothetical protein